MPLHKVALYLTGRAFFDIHSVTLPMNAPNRCPPSDCANAFPRRILLCRMLLRHARFCVALSALFSPAIQSFRCLSYHSDTAQLPDFIPPLLPWSLIVVDNSSSPPNEPESHPGPSTTGGARLALPIVPLGFPCVLYSPCPVLFQYLRGGITKFGSIFFTTLFKVAVEFLSIYKDFFDFFPPGALR